MPRRIAVEILPGCLGYVSGVEVRRIARATMDREGLAPEIEVDIVLADEATMTDLNNQVYGRAKPAEYLAFANQADEIWTWPDSPPSLGHLFISVAGGEHPRDEAERQKVVEVLVQGILEMTGHAAEGFVEKRSEILEALGYRSAEPAVEERL